MTQPRMLFPAPDDALAQLYRPERRSWLQALLLFLVVLAAEVSAGVLGQEAGSRLGEPWSSAALVLGALTAAAIVVLGGRWVLSRAGRRAPVELGLRGAGAEMVGGLLIGATLMCTVFLVLWIVGAYKGTGLALTRGVAMGLYMGLVAGFAEELLIRGVLVRLVEKRLGTVWALMISSLVFGLLHLGNPDATLLGALAIVLEAGVLLGACYVLTRRLWMAIGVHVAWNFVQGGVFGSEVSGSGSGRGLLNAAFSGPDWLTGGSMGVEGSLVAVLVCTAAGVLVLLAAVRRGTLLSYAQASALRRGAAPEEPSQVL